MKKQELVELLKTEFTNSDGDIDISGLDFGEFDGAIILSGIQSKGDIYQGYHSNRGDIYQSQHSKEGFINQSQHSNKGEVIN
jgi:hypothetical protein